MKSVNPDKRQLTTAIAAIIAVIAAVVFYTLVDPASTWWTPRCIFRSLTGFDCPGCGFQRAAHAMLHGHFAEAWHFNPFLFFIIPTGLAYLLVEITGRRFPRLRRVMMSTPALTVLLSTVIIWWIVRNIA